MKKLLILSAITFAAISGVNAQTNNWVAINDTHTGNMDLPEFKMNKHEYKKEIGKLNNSEVSFFQRSNFMKTLDISPTLIGQNHQILMKLPLLLTAMSSPPFMMINQP